MPKVLVAMQALRLLQPDNRVQKNNPAASDEHVVAPYLTTSPSTTSNLMISQVQGLNRERTLRQDACNLQIDTASRAKDKDTYVRVVLPAWLMARAIEFSWSWGSLRNATWTLRIPHIITDRSTYNDFAFTVEHRPLEQVQRFMSSKRISAKDLFAMDKLESLFEVHCTIIADS